MRYFTIVLVIILLQSCNKNKEEKLNISAKTEITENSKEADSTVHHSKQISEEVKDGQDDVMLVEDIRFNGKTERIFDLKDFEKVFGKPDSIRLMADEEPCAYIFEEGTQEDRYLYKNGSCFENSKEKVGVNEFRFLNGNYILYKGKRIDAKTTLDDIRKIFPNSVRNIHQLERPGEGKLPVIRLREDKEGISDGHINVYFKNNLIHSIWWWFPC
ncbi:hypothetical protein BBH99_16135 [Chryseobacterium contaminans]|uniref:Lipoprotein n=1 Tax=Chryseobacterium contaminans TaxID=1423959 RepID=A0A1M7EJL7_9FLAO|nr:hypothetical protein [Chryseobacterium contaminans]OCA80261.1 hypothetical protein BBH99_16135 [Chryseobacterium contaminans]SHL91766.1 hypothetical protein SAMN05444407_107208 [Chryseobacterium contaminans]